MLLNLTNISHSVTTRTPPPHTHTHTPPPILEKKKRRRFPNRSSSLILILYVIIDNPYDTIYITVYGISEDWQYQSSLVAHVPMHLLHLHSLAAFQIYNNITPGLF